MSPFAWIRTRKALVAVPAFGVLVAAVAGLFVLASGQRCGSHAEAFGDVQLTLTSDSQNCGYTLKVGQRFAVINSSAHPWGQWPPTMSGMDRVSVVNQTVGSPEALWEIDYETTVPGTIVLDEHLITIHIRQ
jgi:hypothetical protein